MFSLTKGRKKIHTFESPRTWKVVSMTRLDARGMCPPRDLGIQ